MNTSHDNDTTTYGKRTTGGSIGNHTHVEKGVGLKIGTMSLQVFLWVDTAHPRRNSIGQRKQQ